MAVAVQKEGDHRLLLSLFLAKDFCLPSEAIDADSMMRLYQAHLLIPDADHFALTTRGAVVCGMLAHSLALDLGRDMDVAYHVLLTGK